MAAQPANRTTGQSKALGPAELLRAVQLHEWYVGGFVRGWRALLGFHDLIKADLRRRDLSDADFTGATGIV